MQGRRRLYATPLTEEQILTWADAYHARTGSWPRAESGPIPGAPGETWAKVHSALREGHRGLPGGSLARLLAENRGMRNRSQLSPLSREQIIKWARLHFHRTGRWPTVRSGPVLDAPGDTWAAVNQALYSGRRGLPGGESLAGLLARHRRDGRAAPSGRWAWTPGEDHLVRTLPPAEVARRTGRSLLAVYVRRDELGLPDPLPG